MQFDNDRGRFKSLAYPTSIPKWIYFYKVALFFGMAAGLLITLGIIPQIGFGQKQSRMQSIKQDTVATPSIFELGEITITIPKNRDMMNRITAGEMELYNKMEVSKALDMLPGVTLTASGPRNESMVTVRGFDLRQVPVYMDGIPVYVPFDGYVDLARFTTFDLSAIDVSKGFSSVLYGPNSLGGAINLVSRKPVDKIEFDGAAGIINTNGYRGNFNVGSNLGKFYIQGGYSYLHRDGFRMSSAFLPTAYEDGKERDNSYRSDKKYSLKIGWTPNARNEYVLGFIKQIGSKGTPVYTGNDTLNSLLKKPRFWQWPEWNKETYYFISRTNLGSNHYISSRFYYDIFKNSLFSYDDNTYATMNKPSSFKTWYNDFSYGGSIEYGTTAIKNHTLKAALHYKKDVHRENDLGEPIQHFLDHTITIGAEDSYKIGEKLVLVPGISVSTRKNTRAEEYNSTTGKISPFAGAKTSEAFNGQTGLFYYFKEKQKAGVVYSHKTRFATIKDRYSYRLGTAIPNPDLKPETSDNFELNYSGNYSNHIAFQAALFYSRIANSIMSINNVEPGRSQMQNAGRAAFLGVELALDYHIANNFLMGVTYSYIQRNNLTRPSLHYTDVPAIKVYGYLQYQPLSTTRFIISSEYNASRFSTSYGTKAGDFNLINVIASQKLWKYLSAEAGLNNIFDKNYSLVEGFPEEGRNFFFTLRWSLTNPGN